MFDDFREQAGDGDLFDDDEPLDFDSYDEFEEEQGDSRPEPESPPPKPERSGPFLGLTPSQRLLLSILLFILTCILSFSCLILTGNMQPI
jgi:hypothetical protein